MQTNNKTRQTKSKPHINQPDLRHSCKPETPVKETA
ncbi:hypothetical protein SOVF_179010 [Spinacia oleracea]|nr:hypothetical protein SOVF_179010 [Spinacia oleracea]